MAAPVFTTTANRFYLNFEGLENLEIKSMAALTYEGKVTGGDKPLHCGKRGSERQTTIAGYETNPSMTIEVYVNDDTQGAAARLFEWFLDVMPKDEGGNGNWASQRKSGSVVVYDPSNAEVLRWNLDRAWIKKYSVSDVDATSGELVMETYEFVAERITKVVAMSQAA
ncbi:MULTISPECIES: phage tail protein [unclassified Roseofilum]|uniref:phage tail protein n=1 Tax=unclassified Roseofilum TaxID=2620099 RepID=UPI000E9456D2|nr:MULTISPECIES: phage tail protein [unclassified Roseofilum]HBQ98308.1 hypothetical protein [Cyanobacteria bacterium UBA11691]MBP0008352.1 phage tail protein [Roseofilum sp. Belize Diploria]MBP0034229.1 phage tail protein [Roseofilum sp. Belize BBD 4]MBP0037122.1 phage tail protein [Roseofilum sp. SID1]MBP0042934.1 phage tail protein [Roseofilum sp. SBFL]